MIIKVLRLSIFPLIVVCILWLFVFNIINITHARGNYPESSLCPTDKPYYAICTHSLHNLEGWHGTCFNAETKAQQDAEQHARTEHKGNMRWTGVHKIRSSPSSY